LAHGRSLSVYGLGNRIASPWVHKTRSKARIRTCGFRTPLGHQITCQSDHSKTSRLQGRTRWGTRRPRINGGRWPQREKRRSCGYWRKDGRRRGFGSRRRVRGRCWIASLAKLPPLPTWDVQLEGTITVRLHASSKASAVWAAREIITTANDAGGRVEQAQLTARAAKKIQPIESK
jgi:hypothetical protein